MNTTGGETNESVANNNLPDILNQSDAGSDNYDDRIEDSEYDSKDNGEGSSDDEGMDELVIKKANEIRNVADESDIHQTEDESSDDEGNDSLSELNGDNGVKLEAFNMDEEDNVTGKDAEDEFKQEDQWLNDYNSKASIKRAKEAHDSSTLNQKRKKTAPLDRLEEALEQVFYFIPADKTVQESLHMYQQLRKRLQKQQKDLLSYVVNAIQSILVLVNVLEQKGIKEVMKLDKRAIELLYNEENIMGSIIGNDSSKKWSFKWVTDLTTIHEPFSDHEMQSWKDNYFNSNVLVKRFMDNDEPKNWYHIDCMHFQNTK